MKAVIKNLALLTVATISLVAYNYQINANLSQESPLQATKSITIELTKDVTISQLGTPCIAAASFGSIKPETVTIHSNCGAALIIGPTGIWDLRSFNSKNKTIAFAGNARLVLKPGAQIMGNGGTIRFTGTSRFTIE